MKLHEKLMRAAPLKHAADVEDSSRNWVIQPKYDGVHGIWTGGRAISRTGLIFPNTSVQSAIRNLRLPEGAEFEIALPGCGFAPVQGLLKRGNSFDRGLCIFVFDVAGKPGNYAERMNGIDTRLIVPTHPLKLPLPEAARDIRHFAAQSAHVTDGCILRDLDAPYTAGLAKFQGLSPLYKFKPFQDAEFKLVDIKPMDASSKRFTHGFFQTTGSLVFETLDGKYKFSVGSGLSNEQREAYWKSGPVLLGKLGKVSYLSMSPTGIPREARFVGFRDMDY